MIKGMWISPHSIFTGASGSVLAREFAEGKLLMAPISRIAGIRLKTREML